MENTKEQVKSVFNEFLNGNITYFDLCRQMLTAVGINTNVVSEKPIDFKDFYTKKTPFVAWPDWVRDIYNNFANAYFLGDINDKNLIEKSQTKEYLNSLSTNHKNYKDIFLMAVELKDGTKVTRTLLAQITRAFNRLCEANPVVVFVKYGGQLALCQCERNTYIRSDLQPKSEKLLRVSMLRDINLKNPHHGHLAILEKLDFSAAKHSTTFMPNGKKYFLRRHLQRSFTTNSLLGFFGRKTRNWTYISPTISTQRTTTEKTSKKNSFV